MRVLFYNHTGRASGAERVLILALQHLDKTVVEPRVVCPPGELARAVEALGVPVNTIGELNARFTLWPHELAAYALSVLRTVLALRSEIKRSGAEVVHANSVRGGIAAIFATTGTPLPVIWHVHDELISHPITTFIRWLAGCYRRCSIIAVSAATARSFIGGSAKLSDRVTVIHNAVDVAAIDQQAGTSCIREDLGLAENDFLFGIVGQITPRKGQLELIQAFGQVANALPFAKLLIIGAPIFNKDILYQQQLFDLTDSLGLVDRVAFVGHRPDAVSVIKQLDTLIINSKSEAFVIVGLEAMACRTPIIATDVGGTREMIEDGVDGLLIPNSNKAALKAALLKMYGDPVLREILAGRAREKVERRFNISRFRSEFHQALVAATVGISPIAAPVHRRIGAAQNS